MNPASNPKKKNTVILIIVIIVALVLIFYLVIQKSGKKQPPPSSLASQTNGEKEATALSQKEIEDNTSFLSTLLSLNKLTIDSTLFTNTSFKNLKDNSVSIVSDQVAGRPNPFAEFNQKIKADNSTTLPEISPNKIPTVPSNKK